MQDEQRRAILSALLKVLGLAVVLGLVVGLGTFALVKALGVDGNPHSVGARPSADDASPSSLPTVALSSPGQSSSPSSSATPSTTPKPKKQIVLAASPAKVSAGGKINLTGRYRGRDNVALVVQRKESGSWTAFAGVKAPVRVGAFATYVLTSRPGANVFRVMDPTSGKASNPVTVTVG